VPQQWPTACAYVICMFQPTLRIDPFYLQVRVAGLDVRNKGWNFQSIGWQDRREPEELRVRGYKLVKREQKEIDFDKPGEYVVSH
jgi:hypothetical protein